jgi:hypothetical protein
MQWLQAQEYVSFGLLDASICHDEGAVVKCLPGSSGLEVNSREVAKSERFRLVPTWEVGAFADVVTLQGESS